MASITIRNLDETAKQALRERAAKNGHSMEEEARLLLSASNIPSPQREALANASRQMEATVAKLNSDIFNAKE